MARKLTGRDYRDLQGAVVNSVFAGPSVGEWCVRIGSLGHDGLSEAVAGLYCGTEGRIHVEVEGTGRWLTMTWYNKRVEVAYLS